ncbi:MAG: hypothetical protein ACLGIW_22845, partial [Gammaproteobacteria bacterium]
ERRAQALSLDSALLAELLGTEELRELIDPEAVAARQLEQAQLARQQATLLGHRGLALERADAQALDGAGQVAGQRLQQVVFALLQLHGVAEEQVDLAQQPLGEVLVWLVAVGMFLLGLMFGSFSEEMERMVDDNPTLAQYFEATGGSITDTLFATSLLFNGLGAGAFAVA